MATFVGNKTSGNKQRDRKVFNLTRTVSGSITFVARSWEPLSGNLQDFVTLIGSANGLQRVVSVDRNNDEIHYTDELAADLVTGTFDKGAALMSDGTVFIFPTTFVSYSTPAASSKVTLTLLYKKFTLENDKLVYDGTDTQKEQLVTLYASGSRAVGFPPSLSKAQLQYLGTYNNKMYFYSVVRYDTSGYAYFPFLITATYDITTKSISNIEATYCNEQGTSIPNYAIVGTNYPNGHPNELFIYNDCIYFAISSNYGSNGASCYYPYSLNVKTGTLTKGSYATSETLFAYLARPLKQVHYKKGNKTFIPNTGIVKEYIPTITITAYGNVNIPTLTESYGDITKVLVSADTYSGGMNIKADGETIFYEPTGQYPKITDHYLSDNYANVTEIL